MRKALVVKQEPTLHIVSAKARKHLKSEGRLAAAVHLLSDPLGYTEGERIVERLGMGGVGATTIPGLPVGGPWP